MVVLICLLFFFAVYLLWAGMVRRGHERSAEAALVERMRGQQAPVQSVAVDDSDRTRRRDALLASVGSDLRRTVLNNHGGRSLITMLDQQARLAGNPRGWGGTEIVAWWTTLVVGAVVGGGLLNSIGLLPSLLYPLLILFALAYPWLRLRSAIARRQRRAFRQLPYFLDEIIMGMSSGDPVRVALRNVVYDRTTTGLRNDERVLVVEFRRALHEINTQSRDPAQALRSVSQRIRVSEVDDFIEQLVINYDEGSDVQHNLESMSSHVFKIYDSHVETLIKRKDLHFSIATVLIMLGTAVVIIVPIFQTVIKAMSGANV